jgi:RimJ/RimL family protein N-acetyltransferase
MTDENLVLVTRRLALLKADDSHEEFIHRLLNDPSWIENIGDKQIATLADARDYIHDALQHSYDTFGHGLFVVSLKPGMIPIGLCGLINREFLDEVDLGFAFLPGHCGQGYATEAAGATLNYARTELGLLSVVAITLPSNHLCIRLLEKLGFQRQGMVQTGDGADRLELFSVSLVD